MVLLAIRNIQIRNGLKEIYYNIMKQIIINITTNEEGRPNIIINVTKTDETKIVKVVQPDSLLEKDLKFFEDLKTLINEYNK